MLVGSLRVAIFCFCVEKENITAFHAYDEVNIEQGFFAE